VTDTPAWIDAVFDRGELRDLILKPGNFVFDWMQREGFQPRRRSDRISS
jgi:hypothetical protein